jgi:hypothetical protein
LGHSENQEFQPSVRAGSLTIGSTPSGQLASGVTGWPGEAIIDVPPAAESVDDERARRMTKTRITVLRRMVLDLGFRGPKGSQESDARKCVFVPPRMPQETKRAEHAFRSDLDR